MLTDYFLSRLENTLFQHAWAIPEAEKFAYDINKRRVGQRYIAPDELKLKTRYDLEPFTEDDYNNTILWSSTHLITNPGPGPYKCITGTMMLRRSIEYGQSTPDADEDMLGINFGDLDHLNK